MQAKVKVTDDGIDDNDEEEDKDDDNINKWMCVLLPDISMVSTILLKYYTKLFSVVPVNIMGASSVKFIHAILHKSTLLVQHHSHTVYLQDDRNSLKLLHSV